MSRKVLAGVGAAIAVLVVVAIVLALQPPNEFDADTPEGTAQRYYSAVNDADIDLAMSYMTDDLARACGDRWWFYEEGSVARVVIAESSVDGDSAEVEVTITERYGDGAFDSGTFTHDETLTMTRTSSVWLISEPTWPMDIFGCREEGA